MYKNKEIASNYHCLTTICQGEKKKLSLKWKDYLTLLLKAMNFKELKIIINYLRRKIQCPHCHNPYRERNIAVLSTTKNEGILFMECSKCGGNILVSVVLDQELKPKQVTIGNTAKKYITTNDVLDMHNFLKSFNGDFEQFIPNKTK